MRSIVWLSVVVSLLATFVAQGADSRCSAPLSDKDIPVQFERLARKQLELEYGQEKFLISRIEVKHVDRVLSRIEARVQVSKKADAEEGGALFWVRGWMNRCDGTLIFRGNTWLADGSLESPRYSLKQLPGAGIIYGEKNAPLKVIAFVDSRCPHCHRLIAYARELLKKGELQIEVRQVAYLETAVEAVKDTRFHETTAVQSGSGALGGEAYLDMLSEFNNTMEIDTSTENYERGLALIQTNTQTARDVLHVTTVPSVLVLDRPKTGEYRLTSLAELNRLFQPDL